MRVFARGFAVALILLCIFADYVCIGAKANSVYSYQAMSALNNAELCADDKNIFLSAYSGKNVYLEQVFPQQNSATLSLYYDVSAVVLCSGKFYILCFDTQSQYLTVYIYDFFSDTLRSFASDSTYCASRLHISCDGESIYMVDRFERRCVRRFDFDGKLLKTYLFDMNITQLFCSYGGVMFACGYNRLFELYGNGYSAVCNLSAAQPVSYIGNDLLIDRNGDIFNIYNGNLSICSVTNHTDFPSGGVTNGLVVASSNDTVFAFDEHSGDLYSTLKMNCDIKQVRALFGKVAVLYYKNGISTVEIINISQMKRSADNSYDGGNISPSAFFFSDTCSIDNKLMTITEINPKTTISALLKGIDHKDFSTCVYNADGKLKKSGNIGTAMTVEFTGGGNSYCFETAVSGDLTGEGNCNTRDKNMMFKYLLDEVSFSGVYLIAADMNSDGKINTVDLLLLMKMSLKNQTH